MAVALKASSENMQGSMGKSCQWEPRAAQCLIGNVVATNPLICFRAAKGRRKKCGCFGVISDALGMFSTVFCHPWRAGKKTSWHWGGLKPT